MDSPANQKGKKKKMSKTQILEKIKKQQIRKIFDVFYKDPQISTTQAAEGLGIKLNIARMRVNQSHKEGYITGPQLRKMSYKNFIEYVIFANVVDPFEVYERLKNDERIIHQSILNGPYNIRIVSKEKITIDGKSVFGPSTDRYISYPPKCSWGTSMQNQRKMIEEFNPDRYTPKNYIENHWDQTVEWTELDEILFKIFKYDALQPFDTIVRKKLDWYKRIVDDFPKKVLKYCKFYTAYFPETINAYLPFIYIIETDYEDFVIDLFSLLPSTIYYYRISNRLILHTWLEKDTVINAQSPLEDVSKELPFLKNIRDLKRKEIVKSESHSFVHCFWRQEVV